MADDKAIQAPAVNTTAAAPAAAPAPHSGSRGHDNRGGDRRGGGGGGGGNRRRGPRQDRDGDGKSDLFEKVVSVNRCAKVVKGGRRFSFSALLVVGDRNGKVGIGFGKANEVSEAVRKATEAAKKRMENFPRREGTIPHEALGVFDGARVLLRPASPGTGLIAGGVVRSVIEAAGLRDVMTKSLGSSTPSNVVRATLDALRQLRSQDTILKLRGRTIRAKAPKVDKTEKAV